MRLALSASVKAFMAGAVKRNVAQDQRMGASLARLNHHLATACSPHPRSSSGVHSVP